MSGPSLDSFHLAYIPAAEATGDVHVPTTSTHKYCVDAVDTLPIPITIRRASSLRLYRCRNHSNTRFNGSGDHDNNGHVGCHPCTENSFRNSHSADHDAEQQQQHQQRDDECECCCCRAERCSLDALDSLLPPSCHPTVRSSAANNDGDFNSAQSKAANMMLAVLVPSSLTRGLINIISQNSHVDADYDETMTPNVKKKNSLEGQSVVKQQLLIDAEIELRKSIHPCLLPNEPRRAIHNPDGVISNQFSGDHKRCNGQDNNAKPSANYPPLFVRGIITSNYVSNCTNFPADAVLLAPVNSNNSSTTSSSPSSHAAQQHNGKSNCLHDQDINLISHYSTLLNHETSSGAPWAAMKAFPVSTLSILPMDCDSDDANGNINNENNNITERNMDAKSFDKAALPCCPVCLNLIEPSSLGLPVLSPQHKCSRWCCSDPNNFHNRNNNGEDNNNNDDDHHNGDGYAQQQQQQQQPHACANEMKFLPWPPSEANCIACHMRTLSVESNTNGRHRIITPLSMEMPRSSSLSLDNNRETTTNLSNNFSASLDRSITARPSNSTLTCYQCNMSTTLWACLTCGVVGCGRYTLKHAAEHNALKGHPYSLELATGRIWDYETGNFVHRRDLVECPVLSRKWGIAPRGSSSGTNSQSSPLVAASSLYGSSSFRRGDSHSFSENGNHHVEQQRGKGSSNGLTHYQYDGLEDSIASCHNNHNQYTLPAASKLSAQPKKSIMISQEYEALLQSALEDQSQHYEGEISRLRSELASSNMQQQQQHTQVSDRESREIHALQKDSERLKHDVDRLSSALLEAQTKEAKHRSMSQRLLREQSIGKELLAKIREETLAEHKSGRTRMEDLEMQISDLNANLRMMSQFAKNEELKQAQIFGTAGGVEKEKSGRQRGKKNRRGRKKG